MTRRRTTSTRRPRPAKRRRARFRLRPVRRLRSVTRKARRAARRRIRRTWRRSLRRYANWRRRQLARHARAHRERQAAAHELAARSITGKPRPAKTAAPTAASGTQTTKRTRDGKFNGSSTTGKRAAAKKIALTPEARKAAAFQRTLAAGNKRVARVDKRTR